MVLNDFLVRKQSLFREDIERVENKICQIINSNSFLIIGGAGSIGQSVVIEIFKRNPKKLHVVDISENNMVELVRNIRSSLGYISGDFRTFEIDCASNEFEALFESEKQYDFILNLSALKHVRSEKDPYTLMRMLQVNILNVLKLLELSKKTNIKNFFSVSTDKSTNPANIMGASKKIMELFLNKESKDQKVSMARFANVAFSDGSLLSSFQYRFFKKQPIVAPNDISRYFITAKESAELCLMSTFFGDNQDIYIPKLESNLHLIKFSDIAINFIKKNGYSVFECQSEEEARNRAPELIKNKIWPCYFFKSDTTGEKNIEEFYSNNEIVNFDVYKNIGIINNKEILFNESKLMTFKNKIQELISNKKWSKDDIVELIVNTLPEFSYVNKGKYLSEKM